nr:clp protease proteolytic subunit [Plantago coronopus]QWL16069.1 clp protease proteolytic subunit [Plantago macrorhiza]
MPIGLPQVDFPDWNDIHTYLFLNRIIILSEPLSYETGENLLGVLFSINITSYDSQLIHFYLNCPGGMILPGLALENTMRLLRSPVQTAGIGTNKSIGVFLLAGGELSQRIAYPNTTVILSEPEMEYVEVVRGGNTVLEEVRIAFQLLLERLERLTKKSISDIREDMVRERAMSPEEALSYGIVDAISLEPKKKIQTNTDSLML